MLPKTFWVVTRRHFLVHAQKMTPGNNPESMKEYVCMYLSLLLRNFVNNNEN
jgi:phosphoglycerate dehydrogenase-like enzyme